MILTRKQEEGLRIAVDRFRKKMPYTCIAGYAGSGKSTLVRFIIDALQIDPERVCYVAYTGKAATVLQQKGCPGAKTAHKLLYEAKPKKDGTFWFKKRDYLEEDYAVIVVDEVSMLPTKMWELLLSHRIYILACGDPGQLPPINPADNNHVLDKPHVFLDEIMRQAQESEIIRLSMHVREGRPISTFRASGAQVLTFNNFELCDSMYMWADQIICATNNRRDEINNKVRELKGFGPEPQIGDKIISLRNHWEDFSYSGDWALTNGSIGTITNIDQKLIHVPAEISIRSIPYMFTDIQLEDDDLFTQVPIDYKRLTTGESFLTPEQEFKMRNNKNVEVDPPYPFAYGYAMTCHKSQGSEWGKVLVIEERFPFERELHKRWMYTACTRASEKLVVIKK